MLDLSKFVEEKIVSVPIRNNSFQYHFKTYSVTSEEGWFKVSVVGNKAKVMEPIYEFSEIEKTCEIVRGYSYSNSIIFHNFDSAKRNWKLDISKEFHFNASQTFSAIKCVAWEDKQLYFISPDYNNYKIFEVKSNFDNDEKLDTLKGITPELRTLFLFHSIERDSLRVLEVKKLKAEEKKKLLATIPGRLKFTFENAGADLISYSMKGKRIEVDWKIKGQSQQYNSVIDADTFKILEAGYCMSGEDKKHNITSVVKLAEDYAERRLTYITRNRDDGGDYDDYDDYDDDY